MSSDKLSRIVTMNYKLSVLYVIVSSIKTFKRYYYLSGRGSGIVHRIEGQKDEV